MERISVFASGHGPWYCHDCIFPVGFLLTGEAEATCRELSPSLPNSVSDFAFPWLISWVGSFFNPFYCQAAPAQRSLPSRSLMKWFLWWWFSSKFLGLAILLATAQVSSSACIYSFNLLSWLYPISLQLLSSLSPLSWDVVGIENHSVGNCKFPVIVGGSETVHCEMKKSQTCYSSHCVRGCSRPLHPIKPADILCKVLCPFNIHI